ncbi:MAG: DUF695 domain-containing protein [Bacteroidota bacterium]
MDILDQLWRYARSFLKRLKGITLKHTATKKLRVFIPEEDIRFFRFVQEDQLGKGEVNKSLVNFEPKEVFRWHCSLMFKLNETDQDGLPTELEETVIDAIQIRYEKIIVGDNIEKPNALFLARLAWNETVELIWRVYRPEHIHEVLTKILEEDDFLRPFDYRIDDDVEWSLVKWHLATVQ